MNNRLDLMRTSTGWAVYLPEYQELFGTAWLPLPFTAEASEEYVRMHCQCFKLNEDTSVQALFMR